MKLKRKNKVIVARVEHEPKRHCYAAASNSGGGPDLEAGSLVEIETSGLAI